MRPACALAFLGSAIVLMAACTSGQTEVQGLPDVTGATGPTEATGPTTATGPTASTGGAFSLDLGEYPAAVSEVAFFTCDGLEGTWRYIFTADFGGGVVFDVDSEVDMAGGEGTLVFGGEFTVLDAGSVSWTDTVDLQLVGTRGIKATNVVVEVDTNIPGFTEDIFENFPKNRTLAIIEGSDRC
jgi:hypothetical protein